ncbi:MAG: hypothetical protein ABEH81_04890 [Halopenitus sp.]
MQTNQKKRCIKSVALSNGSEGFIERLIERPNFEANRQIVDVDHDRGGDFSETLST